MFSLSLSCRGGNNMKPVKPINKIELRFMDVHVKIQGTGKNIEQRALKTMALLIQDRLKVFEVMQELEHEDEEAELKHKKPKIKITEYLKGYT